MKTLTTLYDPYIEWLSDKRNEEVLPESHPKVIREFLSYANEKQRTKILLDPTLVELFNLETCWTALDSVGGQEDSLIFPLTPYLCHGNVTVKSGLTFDEAIKNRRLDVTDLPLFSETFSNDVEDSSAWLNLCSPVAYFENEEQFVSSLSKKRRYKFRKAREASSLLTVRRIRSNDRSLVRDWLKDRWEDEDTRIFSELQFLWGLASANFGRGVCFVIEANNVPEYIVSLCVSSPILRVPTFTLQGIYNRSDSKLSSEIALTASLIGLAKILIKPFVLDPTFATSVNEESLFIYKRVLMNTDYYRPVATAFVDSAYEDVSKPYIVGNKIEYADNREPVRMFEQWKV